MRLVTVSLVMLALSAQAGTQASSNGSVTFIPAARVTAAFAKGEPLVENGLVQGACQPARDAGYGGSAHA